jgi:hypothetical protein
MKIFALALPVFLVPLLAWADGDGLPARMSLDEQQQPGDESLTPMEYFYRHSELEAGVLYTAFDNDLDIETDLGFVVRYGVAINPEFSFNVTYRHYDFSNSDLTGKIDENLFIRGILAGIGWHRPFLPEFAFTANGALGLMRWETNLHEFNDDTGILFSGEAAVTARLHSVLRVKAGVALDLAWTDFHQDSTEMMTNLSFLFGFEFGM